MALAQIISTLEKEPLTFRYTIRVLKEDRMERGRITPKGTDLHVANERAEIMEVGELMDVIWVAAEKKPLAMAIRDTSAWRRKRAAYPQYIYYPMIKAHNIAQETSHQLGVRCIHHKGSKGYNTFYYREADPSGLSDALKLMAFTVHHSKVHEMKFTSPEYSYCVGKLLGYSLENIQFFILTRHEFQVTDAFVSETDKKLAQFNVTLDDFEPKKVSILQKPFIVPFETRSYKKKK